MRSRYERTSPPPESALGGFIERSWNRGRRFIFNPPLLIALILLVVLGYLILAPLFSIVDGSLTLHGRDRLRVPGVSVGEFTLYYLQRTFVGPVSDLLFYGPLLNTLFVSIVMSVVAITIGGILAWLVVRTDLPSKRLIANLAVVPFILPSWTLALAWLAFFKNRRIGGSQGVLEGFGVTPPDWVAYGALPIIVTLALHYFPFAFLLIGGALRDFDGRLEESARILGASRLMIVRRIIVLLIIPSIMACFILIVSRGFGSFGAPAILGSPVNYELLATRLVASMQTGSPGVAYVLALVMIVLGAVFILASQRIVGTRKSFATVGGHAPSMQEVPLGRWRYPAAIAVYTFLALVTVAPLLILLADTLFRVPGNYTSQNFTLQFWLGHPDPAIFAGEPGILRNPRTWSALGNSLQLAIISSFACLVVGTLIGYAVVRLRGTRISTALDQLSFLPYLMPSIALGAAFLSLFAASRGFIPSLYGTMALLILVTAVSNLPFSSRAAISSMMRQGKEIEEAGVMVGASWLTRMRRLIIPLQKAGLLSGVLLPFISAMRELSLLIILITPGTSVLTIQAFTYTDFGYYQLANASMVFLVVIIFGLYYLLQKLTGADLAKGLGN